MFLTLPFLVTSSFHTNEKKKRKCPFCLILYYILKIVNCLNELNYMSELTVSTPFEESFIWRTNAAGFWYKQPVFFKSLTRPRTRRFFNGCVASRFRCDRSRTDRNTLCTLAAAQGQCDDLKSDLPEGEKKKKKGKAKDVHVCAATRQTNQAMGVWLLRPIMLECHYKWLPALSRRRGEGGTSQGPFCFPSSRVPATKSPTRH